jgi:hypothetical protein
MHAVLAPGVTLGDLEADSRNIDALVREILDCRVNLPTRTYVFALAWLGWVIDKGLIFLEGGVVQNC